MTDARVFLLVKRGLYYRPDNLGYTRIKAHAGRYRESDASPDNGVTAIHQDEAPMFTEACFSDLKEKFLLDERERLIKALEPFARIADMTMETPAGRSVGVNVNLCRAARTAYLSATENQHD